MIACVDTHYTKSNSRTAVLFFEHWTDETAFKEYVNEQQQAAFEYRSGRFFLRELPCILNAIEPFLKDIETIVVDGYVQLGNGRAGLGQKLYESLNGKIAVVGVAKNPFQGADEAIEVLHGRSKRPLYVTAVGMQAVKAAKSIENMHGAYRIPTLLKKVDKLARANCSI